jgi:4'-phosphopantetheinyl transferase
VLSAAELERAARYHREVHRSAFLAVHTALREILGAALGVDPASVAYELGPHGKPSVAGTGGLHFNLSDTDGLALVAVSAEGPLGVDVECRRPSPRILEVAERFFSSREVAALEALEPAERPAAFYRIWTRKEAFIKALGTGLARGLETFDVSLEPGAGARLLATRPDPAEAARWRLFDLDAGPDHAAALVARALHPGAAQPYVRLRDYQAELEPAR